MPQVALLRLGRRHLALALEGVRHILLTPDIFPLAWMRPGFSGVFVEHGEVIPLLDLPAILDSGCGHGGGLLPYTTIYGTDLGLVGVPVDQVLHIVDRREGEIHPAAEEAPAGAWSHVFRRRETDYPILDMESLLASLPR